MRAPGIGWSAAHCRHEIAYQLRENCPWMSWAHIAALVGRSDHSTAINGYKQHRLRLLGLMPPPRCRGPRNYTPRSTDWSKEDLAELQRLCRQGLYLREVAAHFPKRTRQAVRTMCNRYGFGFHNSSFTAGPAHPLHQEAIAA